MGEICKNMEIREMEIKEGINGKGKHTERATDLQYALMTNSREQSDHQTFALFSL